MGSGHRKKNKKLRTGFTTGAAAAAAAKAALLALGEGGPPSAVAIRLLIDEWIRIPVHQCILEKDENGNPCASCTVIKDAGDDPDVTHRAEIGARVRLCHDPDDPDGIAITGGQGVGTITRPGLELPPGEPAINPGPRQMIREAINDARRETGIWKGAHVTVFVPCGEAIAKRTLNARLGIVGGISILGTTGVVTPMSHEAYIATIASGLSVARACGTGAVVLTTGRRSERHAQGLFPGMPEAAFIQMGDFFGRTMEMVGEMAGEMVEKKGLEQVILAAFFGKALKMAQGARHTHAASTRLSLAHLERLVAAPCAGTNPHPPPVASANTAREAFYRIRETCPQVLEAVVQQMIENARRFSGNSVAVRGVLFDFDGRVVADLSTGKGDI